MQCLGRSSELDCSRKDRQGNGWYVHNPKVSNGLPNIDYSLLDFFAFPSLLETGAMDCTFTFHSSVFVRCDFLALVF